MSWPIGYTNPGFRFRATLDGTIFAQDVQVTEVSGWIVVPIPEGALKPGLVDVSVRLRLSVDSHGHPFLYAEELECRGKHYLGVFALIHETSAEWVEPLRRCVFAEIARRVSEAAVVQSKVARSGERRVSRDIAARSADETWEGVEAPLAPPRR